MKKVDNSNIFEAVLAGYPDMIKISELQKILGISRKYTYKLLKEKRFPAIRVANAYRVPKLCVIEHMRTLQRESEANWYDSAGTERSGTTK